MTTEELRQRELKDSRALWQTCFPNDSTEFLDLYFREKYDPSVNLIHYVDGRPAAVMQLLPYRFRCFGQTVNAGYVSGLCTHPDFRGKGLAKLLLDKAHRRLYEQGAVFSLLIPGSDDLRRFYTKPSHGAYATISYRKEESWLPTGNAYPAYSISPIAPYDADVFVLHQQLDLRTDNALLSSFSDWQVAIATCQLEGGQALVARRKGKPAGIALAVKESNGRVVLRDFLAKRPGAKGALIQFLSEHYDVPIIYDRAPCQPTQPEAQPYLMMRIVNMQKFVQLFYQPTLFSSFEAQIKDDLSIPENNGTWIYTNNQVLHNPTMTANALSPANFLTNYWPNLKISVRNLLDE